MSEISRMALFGKLDPLAYRAIENGAAFCKLRGNPYVELAHWVHQILLAADSDLRRLVRHFELDEAALERDLSAALDRLPRGASAVSDISAQVDEAVERGWVFGSLMFNAAKVRTGHLVIGMLRTPNLRNALYALSRQFEKISFDALSARFDALVDGSPESRDALAGETAAPVSVPAGQREALARYTVDLTAEAREGKLDPIVGRDMEIRQVIDILMRRRQNNPILTGEAGVGKTAVVEGFAQRVVARDVPPALREAVVRTLDVGLLQAGAGVKGEFENRLRQVIEEVQTSEKPVILFIDEAHTLVGAAGTNDAANLLKPALARGTLRTIAATTWVEYKKHIEKDPALTRRFQVVKVPEPSEQGAIAMMRGLVRKMERHHGVQVLDEALEAAVKLSHRFIPARQLPDKAVSLLDTACARVAVSQQALPPAIDDVKRRIETWQTESEIVAREAALGIDTQERAADVAARLDAERARLADLAARWEAERALVARILAARQAIGNGAGKGAGTGGEIMTLAELKALTDELAQRQGEAPLILAGVDAHAVASVVQDWTGIPVGRMVRDEAASVLDLASTLSRRIVGQDHAMRMIARRVQTARAGLDDPCKPVGVFMLAGTSGVGKTETALALAEALYGGEDNVVTVNMSEYQEAHTVSLLKGAPPGYVGYGEGGVLTEAVRRRPYSVVLLDEFEKAHPDVHKLFFQVFDKGRMEDGEGREIDFSNTLILLTTNVGTELITHLCSGGEGHEAPSPEEIARALREPLLDAFSPALLGRVAVIPYYPLDDAMLDAVIRLQLARIGRRIGERHRVSFTYDDAVIGQIARRCTELASGGRMIDAILANTVLPRVSAEFLSRLVDGRRVGKVEVGVLDGDFTYAFD